jgi:hypothetical protein
MGLAEMLEPGDGFAPPEYWRDSPRFDTIHMRSVVIVTDKAWTAARAQAHAM